MVNNMKQALNQIIQGNTLEVVKDLPDSFIDVTVTSPPYNKKQPKSGKNSIMKAITYDCISDNLPESVYQQEQIDILNEIYRSTKDGGSLFYNHKIRYLKGVMTHPIEWLSKTDWHMRQIITWDRSACVEVGGYRFYQVDELVFWLYKPCDNNVIGSKMLSKHARTTSIWRFTPDRKNPHPAPYPLEFPLRCILSMLDEDTGLVFDPYMGSGTTGVAATLLNKDWLGIDISENYIESANTRISNSESERYKLESELENHVVKKSYKQRQKEKKEKSNGFF